MFHRPSQVGGLAVLSSDLQNARIVILISYNYRTFSACWASRLPDASALPGHPLTPRPPELPDTFAGSVGFRIAVFRLGLRASLRSMFWPPAATQDGALHRFRLRVGFLDLDQGEATSKALDVQPLSEFMRELILDMGLVGCVSVHSRRQRFYCYINNCVHYRSWLAANRLVSLLSWFWDDTDELEVVRVSSPGAIYVGTVTAGSTHDALMGQPFSHIYWEVVRGMRVATKALQGSRQSGKLPGAIVFAVYLQYFSNASL